MTKFGWCVAALALLAGCAAPQTRLLLERPAPELPARAELRAVPFFPQEAHQCGPAALATALGAQGAEVAPESLASEIYLPAREGSLAPEMLAATRRPDRCGTSCAGCTSRAAGRPRSSARDPRILRESRSGRPIVVRYRPHAAWVARPPA